MGKYIKGKSINDSNSNNVKDLESISKVVCEFLSSIYDSYWDGLYVDDSNTSFRNKVKSKFNPQIPKTSANNKEKKTVKPTFILSLPLPISAKL